MVQCVVNRYTIKVRMIDKRVDIDLIVFYIYTCKCLLCISINYNTKMSKCCDMNDGRSNLWKKYAFLPWEVDSLGAIHILGAILMWEQIMYIIGVIGHLGLERFWYLLRHVTKNTPNDTMMQRNLFVLIVLVVTSKMGKFELCGITTLFNIFLEINKHQILSRWRLLIMTPHGCYYYHNLKMCYDMNLSSVKGTG